MFKKIGYAIILWVVPYVTAIPLLPLMQSDQTLFKTIMIVEASILAAILAAMYFEKVKKNFLEEGIVLGVVWVVVNWILDFIGLLPFSKMPLDRYFLEIGFRYIVGLSLTISIGYILSKKLKA
jgi:uncharacterized membrane protein YpjA